MPNIQPATTSEPEVRLDTFQGTDELNIAEFPLSILGERPEGVKTLEFCDMVFDSGAGKEVTRKLTITGSDLYGLPGQADEDVLMVMMYLTNVAKFESRTVTFSRHQLLKLLKWSDKGQNYERLEESLRRWLGVTLYYENAWWDKKAKAWVDRDFHILSNMMIYDRKRRGDQSELPLSSFTWNEVIFDSFLARNTKALDLDAYFSLSLAPAKRMYRFLDKRFGAKRGTTWRFDLREFACEHVGFSRNYDSAQLKRKMQPSLLELEEQGFLEPLPDEKRYPKGARRGQWSIVVSQAVKRIEEQSQPVLALPPAPSPLEVKLIACGVTAVVAAELVGQHPAEQIETKMDVLSWLIERKDKKVTRSPAGYLVKSIKDDYALPAGYVPKAEREKRQQVAEDRKRQQQEAEQVRRRQEKDERAAQRAERTHIDRYLGTLSTVERKALEERAITAAEPDEQERAKPGLFAEIMRRLLVDRQVLKECPLAASQKETERPPSSGSVIS